MSRLTNVLVEVLTKCCSVDILKNSETIQVNLMQC